VIRYWGFCGDCRSSSPHQIRLQAAGRVVATGLAMGSAFAHRDDVGLPAGLERNTDLGR
jgi:hypothetical protein